MFAVAAPIFRAELVALAGPILLFELLRGTISFTRLLATGIPVGLLSIGTVHITPQHHLVGLLFSLILVFSSNLCFPFPTVVRSL